MVLESIIGPEKAERNPRDMLWVGFVCSTIGLFLALSSFGPYASIAGIFLTSMPLVVIMYKTMRYEEKKDRLIVNSLQSGKIKIRHEETFLIKEHGKALSLFIALFLGMVVSSTLWYTLLPKEIGEKAFDFQINEIKRIRASVTGRIIDPGMLINILGNNFRVWFFCIIFSFLYGAGAIFILTLNASVVGVAIGSAIRNSLASYAHLSHLEFLYNYFGSFSVSFCYLIHGIPEISAYFLGALGGGIISVAVANHEFRTREFKHIIIDSLDLIILSAVLLILAGVMEVSLTPLICGGV